MAAAVWNRPSFFCHDRLLNTTTLALSASKPELKRELGLRDLVLAQILFMMGFGTFGASARLGPGHVTYWLIALVLFFIPEAMTVIHLTRWRPLEGGAYEWVRGAFGDGWGFIAWWNMWISSLFIIAEAGIWTVTNLAYAVGPDAVWIADSKPVAAIATIVLILTMAAVSVAGSRLGKWVYNLGG